MKQSKIVSRVVLSNDYENCNKQFLWFASSKSVGLPSPHKTQVKPGKCQN